MSKYTLTAAVVLLGGAVLFAAYPAMAEKHEGSKDDRKIESCIQDVEAAIKLVEGAKLKEEKFRKKKLGKLNNLYDLCKLGKFGQVKKKIHSIAGKLTAGGKANAADSKIGKCLSDVAEYKKSRNLLGFGNGTTENNFNYAVDALPELCNEKKFKKVKAQLAKIKSTFTR